MLFVDSSNTNEIKKWICDYDVCRGVTTNPKILFQDNHPNIKKVIEDILKVSKGYPVNIELTRTNGTDKDLINEAAEYADNIENIVIKVPMWSDGRGLRIARQLQKIQIQTNITCCMNVEQVILAALAGANYVSLFFRRIVDYYISIGYSSEDAYEIACKTVLSSSNFLSERGLGTQLIVGSIREPRDVTAALLNGTDIVTVTPNILDKMFQHPKSEETIKEFDEIWRQLKQ